MLAKIFRALEQMHRDNHWDGPAADAFGAIAKWLEDNHLMPI